ncbi:MAG TPA: tetratricopeptide repeat protein [Flavipsychrobacter sp.]|nr:tetratricopeptide repeat protein [Flavipsychrobacter sp.]
MRPVHYIVIAAALSVVAALFYLGNTTPPKPQGDKKMPSIEDAAAMQRSHVAHPASFDSLLEAARKELPEHAKEEVAAVEKSIAAYKDSASMAGEFEKLAKVWQEHKQLPIAANYYLYAGKLANSEKKLTFAAQLFLDLARKSHSESVQAWEGQMAIEGFEKVLAINPENDTATVSLAECYIGTGQTMQGVLLLRDFTAKKPDNIPANLILGQQGIVSGQLDKALLRFENVLDKDPENMEALLGIAEVHKNKGNKVKAVEALERAKKIMNNPDFSKDIDNYIKSF